MCAAWNQGQGLVYDVLETWNPNDTSQMTSEVSKWTKIVSID